MSGAAGGYRRALLALALATVMSSPLAAQPRVRISGIPDSGPLPHLTPRFVIETEGFDPADPVVSIRIQVGTRDDFTGWVMLDTTVSGASATIALLRPLPQDSSLYWRASARTEGGLDVQSPRVGPRATLPWLTLTYPNEPNGTAVTGRHPTFTWTTATVDSPPGPWRFEIVITNAATYEVVAAESLTDTRFIPSAPLEANTPYRWRVTARLGSLDSVALDSRATFVIVDSNAPLTTLLYQSFPNPFPTPSGQAACIWFDLHKPASVSLDIFDLRGTLVRRLVPSAEFSALLPAGRYGRASSQGDAGCDMRLAWDGRGDDGRTAPAGVYLVRLRAGDRDMVKKILFRGR